MNLPSSNDPGSTLTVSVIIPAFNEEKSIGKCLSALQNSSLPRDRFEVILVDNGSTDRTAEIARQFVGLRLTVLSRPAITIGAVRNAGAASATGDVLAFLDADCVAPPDWLPEALRLVQERGGIVGGPYGVPDNYTWVAQVWANHEARSYNGPRSFVHGANLIVRRSNFLALAGFDEALATNEDYELCQRGIQAGLTVWASPQLSVIHLGTVESLGAFFKRQRWHGRHVVKVFLRSLPKVRNARAIGFAVYMFLAIASVLPAVLSLARDGQVLPVVLSLCAMLAAPLALSAREGLRRRNAHQVLSLACLFLVYGIARAMCLADFWFTAPQRRAHR